MNKETRIIDGGKDPNQVALYIFRYRIGDAEYGGEIPAKSYEDALSKVSVFGATVDGRAVETQHENLCAICRGTVGRDETVQEPLIDDAWAEDFD